ncbi:probable acyl-activating enzyme 1, peroxisomal [Punica granatum]|uniref:Probable acyl-activating enzyme 1, peroxisomal n=2 Tax=Punica granatum TaxID=22663 RepID=A0A6P8BWK8_PUNGR|nr:probable acyl-activating enzyme 1, peroxisomal [Punica granatum]
MGSPMNRFLFKNSRALLSSQFNRYLTVINRSLCAESDRWAAGGWPEPESWKSMEGLVRCSANHAPLSPISFLERSAKVHRDRTSLVYGPVEYTWGETHARCVRLASALAQLGISRGDVVATLAPNVPAMYELHFAVPMAGAVLCTLNARHDPAMVSVLLRHSGAKLIFVDYELYEIARRALDLIGKTGTELPVLVVISQLDGSDSPSSHSAHESYEDLVAGGCDDFDVLRPNSEWDPISINYTSGTTSRPKGVVYCHRGAYLNSISTFLLHGMGPPPVNYLWTVPMFHCNGWCLTWGMAALGGTNISLRKVTPRGIFDNITRHGVTHMGGVPTVLNMIVNSPATDRQPLPHPVVVMTGGSPPPPQILSGMAELGFQVSHLYGLTETYGPGTYCDWKPEWDSLPNEEKFRMKARQGFQHLGLEEVDVQDPITMSSIPADGQTIGEVMFRGNTVMCGYLKDHEETRKAFEGGWFHSGDLAVKHPDGYLEVKDRLKDVIISGGENISSVEVETVLYSHPAVLEAAVVARPDNHWGQTPCAFVKLKEGCQISDYEILDFCRARLPHYMAPRTVVFEDLPRTSTGKVQKFILREKAKALGSLS